MEPRNHFYLRIDVNYIEFNYECIWLNYIKKKKLIFKRIKAILYKRIVHPPQKTLVYSPCRHSKHAYDFFFYGTQKIS